MKERILEELKKFEGLEEEYLKRTIEKVELALKDLKNDEAERLQVYRFTENPSGLKIAEIDSESNNVLLYPPFSTKPTIIRVEWAVIGDLGILVKSPDGYKLFPNYTKGPGKVLAILCCGRVFHRGGLYVRKIRQEV